MIEEGGKLECKEREKNKEVAYQHFIYISIRKREERDGKRRKWNISILEREREAGLAKEKDNKSTVPTPRCPTDVITCPPLPLVVCNDKHNNRICRCCCSDVVLSSPLSLAFSIPGSYNSHANLIQVLLAVRTTGRGLVADGMSPEKLILGLAPFPGLRRLYRL